MNIKAIGIKLIYGNNGVINDVCGFQILYENGQTKDFLLRYMDREEQDFEEAGKT